MLSLILFQRIAELFVIIFFGWLIVKVGILKSEDSRCLSMILLYRFKILTLPKPNLLTLFRTNIVVISKLTVSAVLGLIMMTIAVGFSLSHSFRKSKRCSLSSEKIALLLIVVVSSNISSSL